MSNVQRTRNILAQLRQEMVRDKAPRRWITQIDELERLSHRHKSKNKAKSKSITPRDLDKLYERLMRRHPGLNQAEAAAILSVNQGRISEVVNKRKRWRKK